MEFKTRQYQAPEATTAKGRQLLAWYDDDSILVYIPHIGEFYGDKTVSRPIWITPSFSWMVHHADWLQSPHYDNIECMLIKRFAFDDILFKAFPARYPNGLFTIREDWQKQQAAATVQYRWDNDYTPDGSALEREILMLGIHSRTWMQYVIKSQISATKDIDEALFKQKEQAQPPYDLLVVPDEKPYPIDEATKKILDIVN